ncbi:MAG: RidA family protein, partial [Pseudomonadota bacterium]
GEWLSKTVEHNGVVYVCGLTADDRSASMKDQTVEILGKIDAALAKAGTDKTRLLTAMIYLSDMSKKAEMNEAWIAWMDPNNPPARATVGTVLGTPDTLIEIVVSAAK